MKIGLFATAFTLFLFACGQEQPAVEADKTEETAVAPYYEMAVTTDPETLEAGKPFKIAFTPKISGNTTAQVPLDEHHGVKMSVWVVGDDLNFFQRLTPEYIASGAYETEINLPAGGDYRLTAEFIPSGGEEQVKSQSLSVSGQAAPAASFSTENLMHREGTFEVSLVPEVNPPITNNPMHIGAVVKQNGKEIPAAQLEKLWDDVGYAAFMHVASKTPVHAHMAVEHDRIHIAAQFPETGLYRGWLVYKVGGKERTAAFTLDLKPGQPGQIDEEPLEHGQGHGHGEHSHGDGEPHSH